MDNPIFILGSHKAGTSLLRNLLDGVDGLFVIPIELHCFEYSGLWVDYEIRRSVPTETSFEQVLERIEKSISRSNQDTGQKEKFGGDSIVDAGKWDVKSLRDHLETKGRALYDTQDLRNFFDTYVEAVHIGLHGRLPEPGTRFVEKSVENAEFATLLKKLYPGAKFVHIVRNPYATLVSIRKFKPYKGHYPYLGTFLNALENSYYYAYHNPLVVKDYQVICYEQLLQAPEQVMQNLASFLEIPFTDALLKPSALGVEWKGNSMSGREFSGISDYPLEVWKKDINALEIDLINTLLTHVLLKFGYEKIQLNSSPLLPVKGEKARVYLANRFYAMAAKVRRKGES